MSQSVTPPVRSLEQRRAALYKANEIRALRADDKKAISARDLDAREVLAAPAEHWERAKVAELLLAIPAIGRTKTERILRKLQISPSKTLGGMTADQRRRLNEAIGPYCERDGRHGRRKPATVEAPALAARADAAQGEQSDDEPLV